MPGKPLNLRFETVASNDLAQLQTSLDFELEHLKSSIKIQNILDLTRFDIHNS